MKPPRPLAALATLVFLVVLVRTAWISDDALISLRTVMNVTHGFGLTFNPVERVQTFTHPLWLFLITACYLVVRNVYLATFIAACGVSLVVFWIAVVGARDAWRGWLAAGLLLFSHAFVDYSTSGLENPLSCLWIALLVGIVLAPSIEPRRAATGGWLLLAMLYLTRPDDVLMALPVVVVLTARLRRWPDRVRSAAIGLAPAAAWTLFALVYYGFPLPNTAYAKLGAGIHRGEMVTQGLLYLVESIDRDPLTLTVLALAAGVAIATRTAAGRALAAGLVVHVLYVVWIGGDFMSGRFLAAPFYFGVLIVTRYAVGSVREWAPALVMLGAVALSSGQLPMRIDSTSVVVTPKRNGIADERGIYFGNWSLLQAGRWTFREPEWPRASGPPARTGTFPTCGLLGEAGMRRGPYTYILDECALADPLLARLPAQFNEQWRIGHFRRWIPTGYAESIERGTNEIHDPPLRAYYEQVRLATRAPLFSMERWRAIARLNIGAVDQVIDRRYYRYGGDVVRLDQVSVVRADQTSWDDPGNHIVPGSGLAVLCDDRPARRYFDVSVDSNDRYRLIFIRRNAIVSEVEVGPIPEYRRRGGLTHYTVDVPPRARATGFDSVLIVPTQGDDHFALGHLLLEGEPTTDPELHRRVAIRDGLATK